MDGTEDRPVRWAEVAAWSGLPLRSDAQFHSVALLPTRPRRAAPVPTSTRGRAACDEPDAAVLAGILRDWTATPEDCWFCVLGRLRLGCRLVPCSLPWTYSGWPLEAVPPPTRPIPCLARSARVRGLSLPHRELPAVPGTSQSRPRLGRPRRHPRAVPQPVGPAHRAWCVASEIDLLWTYVGGPRGLIDTILADDRIEALPIRARRPGKPGRGVGGRRGRPALQKDLMAQGHGLAQHIPGNGRRPAPAAGSHPQREPAHRRHRAQRRFQQLRVHPRRRRGDRQEQRARPPDAGRAETHRDITAHG